MSHLNWNSHFAWILHMYILSLFSHNLHIRYIHLWWFSVTYAWILTAKKHLPVLAPFSGLAGEIRSRNDCQTLKLSSYWLLVLSLISSCLSLCRLKRRVLKRRSRRNVCLKSLQQWRRLRWRHIRRIWRGWKWSQVIVGHFIETEGTYKLGLHLN